MLHGSLESRLGRIEKLLQQDEESYLFKFTSGDTLRLTRKRVRRMFESIREGDPNKDVQFFLEQLQNGYEDEGGFVYILETENLIWNDPERMKELWSDETN